MESAAVVSGGVKLVRPDVQFRESYLTALREYLDEGRVPARSDLIEAEGFEHFVRALLTMEQAHGVQERFVPQTTLWLVDDDEYIGRLSIRHELNEWLRTIGGHIGYDIRPSRRREGLGKRQLALGLAEARALGLERVLLTCDADNTGSRRIIEGNGGVLENELEDPATGKVKLRFWIDL